jgi:predicted permease
MRSTWIGRIRIPSALPLIEQLWQDVAYGFRMLRRSPGFACIAIAAVGVAIGVNAGFFTLIDAFVWRPIPVSRPERLVKLLTVDARHFTNIRFSYSDMTALRGARTVDDVFAYWAVPAAGKFSSTAPPEMVSAGLVSGNYFQALGGTASVGRVLAPTDESAGSEPAVVISDELWTKAFARAFDVVGREMILNERRARIVGVVRSTFIGINPLMPDLWLTIPHAAELGLTPGQLTDRTNRFFALHARLRPNVSLRQAEGELSGLVAEPPSPGHATDQDARLIGMKLMPNASMVPGGQQTTLMIAPALLVVALLLVIACANVANLLLGRASARQREIAVRLAMGASRGRLMRQLLTESLLIAVAGAVLGLVLAEWTLSIASSAFFAAVPATFGTVVLSLGPNWRVFAYTIGLVCLSVLAFGLAPALQGTSPNLTAALKGEDTVMGTRLRRSRFRDGLIAIEVAASLVLLVAAGMLANGVRSLASDHTGLRSTGVSMAILGITVDGHPDSALAAHRAAFASRVARTDGVLFTARALTAPFGSWTYRRVRAMTGADEPRALPYNRVTPRYFDVVGQRVVDGRAFSIGDSASAASVAVITLAAARALWPDQRAVGQMMRVDAGANLPPRLVQIVGVVADAHSGTLWDDDSSGYIYEAATASDFAALEMPLLVRTQSIDSGFSRTLQRLAREVDPNAPLLLETVDQTHALQVLPFRYGAVVTSGIGLLGLGLALIGLYGVVSFAVQQRRRDIAVHLAIGATGRDVLALVLRRDLRIVLIGLGIGLVLSIGEGRLIENLSLPLPALGVLPVIGILVLLLAVAVTAIVVPATAALRVSPIQVLRQD